MKITKFLIISLIILTGESLSINKAIDAQLVLTEVGPPADHLPAQIEKPEPERDIRTLNIEFVKDPRTDRNITVSEAMQTGLLDRQTLSYHNPLTSETLSLNKAYLKGYIIGHYTDSYIHEFNSHKSLSTSSQSHFHNQQYFIISVFDPTTQKSMSLDQAVHTGLFDHNRSVFIHPQTGEVISLNDSVRRGFVDAQIYEDKNEGIDTDTKRFDSRLPVAAFGIDKKITCMRTKFNKDGTSMLQVEIESLKPTRGIYELDEIEDFNQNSMKEVHSRTNSSHEIRQVVDINSVHHVKETPNPQMIQLMQPVHNLKTEKNFNIHHVDKELGTSLDSQRFEKIIDDDQRGVIKIPIDHPKYRNNNYHQEIPERKQHKTFETFERKECLIINDVDNRRMNLAFNIDGQNHVFKNEVQINSDHQPAATKIDFQSTQKNVEELNRRLIEIESQKTVKRPETEIIDKHRSVNRFLDIEETAPRTEVVNGKLIIDIMNESNRKPVPVETINDAVVLEEKREIWEESYPKIETSITEEIIYEPMEEEDEMFDEWTEVFTITIRNIRYKIIWVSLI